MVSYKDRLAEALRSANASDTQLAKHLGVSIQAIRKVAAGTTIALTAENNSRAARFLKVSPDWLATGEGEMRPSNLWPFDLLRPEHIARLSPKDLRTVEKLAFSLLEEAETPAATNVSGRTVKDEFGESEDVTWTLPPYKSEGRPSGKRVPNPSEAPPKRRGGAL